MKSHYHNACSKFKKCIRQHAEHAAHATCQKIEAWPMMYDALWFVTLYSYHQIILDHSIPLFLSSLV